MPNTFVKRALCFGATALAIGAVAAPAQAASPFLRDTAVCPTGKVALGGGSQVVGEGTADFHTALQESTPGTIGGGAQSLWLTAIRNSAAQAAHDRPVRRLRQAARRLPGRAQGRPVPAPGFIRDTAVCPTGKVVLAGGAQVVGAGTADFKTRMYESAPGTIGGGAQSVWLVAMKNNSLIARTVGIFAVCGEQAGRLPGRPQGLHRRAGRASCATRRPARRQGHPRRRRERDRRRARATSTPACRSSPRAPSAPRRRPARLAAQLLLGLPHGRHPRRLRQPDQRLPGRPQRSRDGLS